MHSSSASIFSQPLPNFFAADGSGSLGAAISGLVSGESSPVAQIDRNMAATQLTLAAIDVVQVPPGDTENVQTKARAMLLAGFGAASPPMAAGAMLLLYQFTIALFIGLAPLFILCLIFEQTKPLFQKWLMYGIGTVFSLAMLSFVSTIVLNVTARAAAALWSSNFINGLLHTSSEGLSTQALEQGGIGLLMTMLVISVPPMAGNFFSATLGNFSPYNVFSRAGQPGPNGQPPGAYGYGGFKMPQVSNAQAGQNTATGGFNTLAGSASSSGARLGHTDYTPIADVTKQGGGLANSSTPRS